MDTAAIWGESALHTAIRTGSDASVADAFATGTDVAALDVLGYAPLHVAAAAGRLEVVAELLERGAAVDARDRAQVTPLMLAVGAAHGAVVERLLQAGADANAKTAFAQDLFDFLDRAADRALLERLVGAGYTPSTSRIPAYVRLALELTGHRVRFARIGVDRGSAGASDATWAVDRPLTVPARLVAAVSRATPDYPAAVSSLVADASYQPWYGVAFVAQAGDFDAIPESRDPTRSSAIAYTERAHAVRCGRAGAAERPGPHGWSALAVAIAAADAAIVLALVRSAGWDPVAITVESAAEAAERAPSRGVFPVGVVALRELLQRALDAERGPAY